MRMTATRTRVAASRSRRLLFVGLAIIAAAIGVAFLAAGRAESGTIAAEQTFHQFGTVRMQDGVLSTSFPLTVTGTVPVTNLGTT